MAATRKSKSQNTSVLLVHWKPVEAAGHVEALEDCGFTVDVYSEQMGKGLGKFRARPPDVLLVSLERLPSHGREIAHWFRTTKATRHVPCVFVGGKADKVARAREAFRDAVFTEWGDVAAAVQFALKTPQGAEPTPLCGTKELWEKLEIREGYTVALLGAPRGFDETLGAMPASVVVRRQARGAAALVVLFPKSVADLVKRWPSAIRMLPDKRRIWLAWPKQGASVRSDVTQDLVRGFGIERGWTDVKICRIDETWSGHMFARKR